MKRTANSLLRRSSSDTPKLTFREFCLRNETPTRSVHFKLQSGGSDVNVRFFRENLLERAF